MAFWRDFEELLPQMILRKYFALARSVLMVIVRMHEDRGWMPAYPTSGTAIEFQFLSLFVTVSFLKVRVRAHARKRTAIRSLA
jgi:hypothetical protein